MFTFLGFTTKLILSRLGLVKGAYFDTSIAGCLGEIHSSKASPGSLCGELLSPWVLLTRLCLIANLCCVPPRQKGEADCCTRAVSLGPNCVETCAGVIISHFLPKPHK